MAISYATNGIKFVNSLTGTGTNKNLKTAVPIIYNRIYHKQVQDKEFWKKTGLIGADTYNEGSVSETVSGVPVLRKTELEKEPGDHIVMSQLRNLTVDVFNTSNTGGGVTGSTQLVDIEQSWDFYHKKVQLERQREGVRTDAGMNKKRNPFKSLEEIEMDLLSDWSSQNIDKSIWFAYHWGQSPHLLRHFCTELAGGVNVNLDTATTTMPASLKIRSNPNLLAGHDPALTTYSTTALAQTQMNTSDTDFATWRTNNKISPASFEIISAFARKNNYDPIHIDGKSYMVCFISPQMELSLRNNAEWRQAMRDAMPRGLDNPIFKHADMVFADCLIYVHNAVNDVIGVNRADKLTGTIVSATDTKFALTPTEYLDDAGATVANKMGQIIFTGANAMCIAEGEFLMGKRTEDDYGTIIGRGVDMTYGISRNDWLSETGPGTTVVNQSSGNLLVGI